MSSQLDFNIRLWAMWCHLSGLAWTPILTLPILSLGIPWSWIVALVFPWLIPIIFWLTSRQLHPFVDLAGRTTVNAALSIFLIGLCLIPLQLFLLERGLKRIGSSSGLQGDIESMLMIIGFILTLIISITHFFMSIHAAIRAYQGEIYCYPIPINFIRGIDQLSADLSRHLS
jgi:uncharacterized protein